MPLTKTILLLLSVLVLACCGDTAPPGAISPQTSEFIRDYYASRGITNETHGRSETIAYLSAKDVPQSLPTRESAWAGSGVELLVKHSQGYSKVAPLYGVNVQNEYSRNGSGEAVPIVVKIDPTEHPSAMYPRSKFRRLKLDQEYVFVGKIYNKKNRASAIAMAREVLAKSHCRGGKVTDDPAKPEIAEAYGRNARTANGVSISPGWAVYLRCSKWRAK